MKLLKTVPAALLLTGGLLRQCMLPPMIPFLLSWMTLPARKTFEGNLNAGYLAQSGNTKVLL